MKTVILALVVVTWAGFARIVRAQTMSLREREFIEAARALPCQTGRSSLITPAQYEGTALVMTSYFIAVTVIVEAGFAFIGLGTQPPTPSLGQMIASGRGFLAVQAWVVIVPGVTIALIVLGLNTLGTGYEMHSIRS